MERQATRLRAQRPLPGAPLGPVCTVSLRTAVASNLPAYRRWRSFETSCDPTDRRRAAIPREISSRSSSFNAATALQRGRRSYPSIESHDPLDLSCSSFPAPGRWLTHFVRSSSAPKVHPSASPAQYPFDVTICELHVCRDKKVLRRLVEITGVSPRNMRRRVLLHFHFPLFYNGRLLALVLARHGRDGKRGCGAISSAIGGVSSRWHDLYSFLFFLFLLTFSLFSLFFIFFSP